MKGSKVLVILLISLVGAVLVQQLRTFWPTHGTEPGLVLVASREGSLGAVTLRLYKDQDFEFWNSGLSGMSKGAHGLYKLAGDTLILKPRQEDGTEKATLTQRYVVSDGTLTTIPTGTGLVLLGITLDRRTGPN